MRKTKKSSSFLRHDPELIGTRARQAERQLARCTLCPRRCGVNRVEGQAGFCGIGPQARVASFGPHFGEESVLVGENGSGAIFFSGCNLQCVFCQNHAVSSVQPGQAPGGEEVSAVELAGIMLELQARGCANINLVTPSHVVPQILAALAIAAGQGLHLPIVYNTSSYDRLKTLRLLEGIVQIYMPDCKFWSADKAGKYLAAPDYPDVMQAALREMYRQTGDLVVDDQGVAARGLLVRHLVMPGMQQETEWIMAFLAREISRDTYVNVMDQYHPCYRAHEYPEIDRMLSVEEYNQAMRAARAAGLHRFAEQDISRLVAMLAGSQKRGIS
jgi:putative pyruvate formate lyase activating enzyme